MLASTDLIKKLDDYLKKHIPLWELESWLVPRLPMYLDAPDSECGRLAGAIELCLAELQAGLKSERTMRSSLARYLATQQITWYSSEREHQTDTTTSASSDVNSFAGLLSQLQFWSNEPVKEAV